MAIEFSSLIACVNTAIVEDGGHPCHPATFLQNSTDSILSESLRLVKLISAHQSSFAVNCNLWRGSRITSTTIFERLMISYDKS